MKGDKGDLSHPKIYHRSLTDVESEFAGTLLGFDDYVSKFYNFFISLRDQEADLRVRYGAGGRDRIVSGNLVSTSSSFSNSIQRLQQRLHGISNKTNKGIAKWQQHLHGTLLSHLLKR